MKGRIPLAGVSVVGGVFEVGPIVVFSFGAVVAALGVPACVRVLVILFLVGAVGVSFALACGGAEGAPYWMPGSES